MSKHHQWFALISKSRHEKLAARNLQNKGLEDFLPLYRARRSWSDRVKFVDLPLFPGYVFCRFDYQDRLKALTTPGVTGIVSFGNMPAAVDEAEITAIQTILKAGLPAQPWPYMRIGQKVRIERGALCGLEGTLVREKENWRVVVNVELLQRSVAVEIDRDMICAVSGAAYAPTAQLYLADCAV